MHQIEVQIMGQGYLLSCPENGETTLMDAVSRVDTAMCRIRDAGKVKARDRIAVLASLNLAFELSEVQQQLAQRPTAPALDATPPPQSPSPTPEATPDGQPTDPAFTAHLQQPDADADQDPAMLDALLQRLDQALAGFAPPPATASNTDSGIESDTELGTEPGTGSGIEATEFSPALTTTPAENPAF
jgi:cell division protein ZapA